MPTVPVSQNTEKNNQNKASAGAERPEYLGGCMTFMHISASHKPCNLS